MSKLDELKQVRMGELTLDQTLRAKHSRGQWHQEGDIIIFAETVQGSPRHSIDYRWRVEGNSFLAINGKTQKFTPLFDPQGLAKEQAEWELIPYEKSVHDRYNELFEAYDGPILNEEIENEMAQQVADYFEITREEVTEIYAKVQAHKQKIMDKA